VELFEDKSQTLQKEKYYKTGKGRLFIKNLIFDAVMAPIR